MRLVHSIFVVGLVACGGTSSGTIDAPADHPGDAAQTDGTSATDAATDAALDAPLSATGVDCFQDWPSLGNCGAPVLTAAYLTNDCEATTGVFVVGHGFESSNLFMVNNAWLPYGPQVISSNNSWSGDFWNELTPTFVCITTSATPGEWSGFAIQLKNPDGQVSNSVTVQNLLGMRPPFVSTDSDDPFDPDACLDAGMTQAEALATFAPAASTSTLGMTTVMSHTRTCNTATGCAAWTAPTTTATNVVAGLALMGSGSTIDFTLGGADCGRLGGDDQTLTYSLCPSYRVHVAAHCLRASSTARSTVGGDGSYTQTDVAALLRF